VHESFRAACALGVVLAPEWVVSRYITALTIWSLACAPVGCYATAGGYTEADYVEVETVPPHVEIYPHYYYGGRTVYLVDGRWYYRRGPRWVYYRDEPVELHRHRVHVQRAPRAPDHYRGRPYHRRARPVERSRWR
jgi:hypothetical protein